MKKQPTRRRITIGVLAVGVVLYAIARGLTIHDFWQRHVRKYKAFPLRAICQIAAPHPFRSRVYLDLPAGTQVPMVWGSKWNPHKWRWNMSPNVLRCERPEILSGSPLTTDKLGELAHFYTSEWLRAQPNHALGYRCASTGIPQATSNGQWYVVCGGARIAGPGLGVLMDARGNLVEIRGVSSWQ
jgi:hypothetical protein